MINNTNLIKLDIYSDYIPIISSVTNIFNLFQIFFIRNCIKNENMSHPYFSYIKDKSYFRVATACIPIFGNIAILFSDYLEERNIVNAMAKGNIEPFITSNIAFKYDKQLAMSALIVNRLAFQYIGKTLQNDTDIIFILSKTTSTCKRCRIALQFLQQKPNILQNGAIQPTLLFSGTQKYCDGNILPKKVQSMLERLSKNQENGISFNKDKIVKHLIGGTCSAMSLKFAKNYVKFRKELPDCNCENHNITALALLSQMHSLQPKFATSNEKMRTRQAVFNTIEVIKTESPINYSKNKIQSLANYYGFTIDYASDEFDITRIETENELASYIDSLPQEGVFLIRNRLSINNKRGLYGHSMIYINNDLFKALYDPGFGLYILDKKTIHKDFFTLFKAYSTQWSIDTIRFYRLAKG